MITPSQVEEFQNLASLNTALHVSGCKSCSLGFQPNINGCCVSRGNLNSRFMLIGEAPGKEEDSTREPFTGPAGQLLDKIWESVGMRTQDWYLTNVVLCRPASKYATGKQNYTPQEDQMEICAPYLEKQIRLVRPLIIVTVGLISAKWILGRNIATTMGAIRGKLTERTIYGMRIPIFPMIHPAAILHATGDEEKQSMYRRQTWEDIQQLRRIVDGIRETYSGRS